MGEVITTRPSIKVFFPKNVLMGVIPVVVLSQGSYASNSKRKVTMPFVAPKMTKEHYVFAAVFTAVICGVFAWGSHIGRLQERLDRQAAISTEARELMHNAVFNSETTNPNDAMLWAGLLSEAKLCDNCNALREYRSVPGHTIRPLILSINGDDAGSTKLTMVFGTLAYSQGHRSLTPKIAYYIGHRSGSLARIDESGNVEYRVGSDEWRPAEDGSVLRNEARETFQKQWQTHFASVRQ